MDKGQNGVSLLTKFLRNLTTIFTLSVLVISIAGMITTHYDPAIQEASSMFSLAPIGIAYNTILQIAGFSFILAAISAFLFSEYFNKKMRFLLRSFLLFIATILIFLVFTFIFKWVPFNEPIALLAFFLSTLVCYSISIGLTILKLKFESKKYSKLLENYKARNIVNP